MKPWMLYPRNHKGESIMMVEAVELALSKMSFIKWKE